MNEIVLKKDAFGRLLLQPSGSEVVPVRAHPITAPDKGISLMGTDGKELAWIEDLETLSDDAKRLVEEALNLREFLPEIKSILSVSSHSAPCEWKVSTDRGETSFVLKSEDEIKRIASSTFIVSSGGLNFLIKDREALDRPSRRLLARFT